MAAIAAALAKKTAGSLYELVKKKLAGQPAEATLIAAADAAPDSPQVKALRDQLAQTVAADPDFADQLRAAWLATTVEQHADHGGVTNSISGSVAGPTVQANTITGGIHFGHQQ